MKLLDLGLHAPVVSELGLQIDHERAGGHELFDAGLRLLLPQLRVAGELFQNGLDLLLEGGHAREEGQHELVDVLVLGDDLVEGLGHLGGDGRLRLLALLDRLLLDLLDLELAQLDAVVPLGQVERDAEHVLDGLVQVVLHVVQSWLDRYVRDGEYDVGLEQRVLHLFCVWI